MSIVSIGNMLDRAKDFENRLEEYFAAIRDETHDNGVKLLTYYLSRHSRHLEYALKDLSHQEIDHLRKIKLKYDIDFHPEKEFPLMDKDPDKVNGTELLDAAIKYDTELLNFYQQILKQPLIDEAVTFIESLIHLEERDVVMMKKMMATHYF